MSAPLAHLAPFGLAADLRTAGFCGPYAADPIARGMVVDRAGHVLAPIGPVPAAPDLRRKLAEFLAVALNALEEEARAIADPFDPAHLAVVGSEGRNRQAGE